MNNPLTLAPLETGDFIPPFCLPDQHGHPREIQNYGGRRTALFFLPAGGEAYLSQFFQAVVQRENEISHVDFHLVYILAASGTELKAIQARHDTSKLGLTSLFWSDEQGHLHRAFGVGATTGKAFLLTPNHKITAAIETRDGAMLLSDVMDRLKAAPKPAPSTFEQGRVHAPVIMIPDAISPALCKILLGYWRAGEKYQGVIGAAGSEQVNLGGKRRIDVDIRDFRLLAQIDEAMCKRVFPELRKVTGVEIQYRERYKIGGYFSEDNGYYHQHRDTGEHLNYRRYSVSIALSDAYEGGYLQFPEYDNAAYKLAARSALVFPSTLLHGVTPVTSGVRHIMVSFFYGAAEDAKRRADAESQGKPFDDGELRLLSPRRFEGVEESRFLYSNSFEK